VSRMLVFSRDAITTYTGYMRQKYNVEKKAAAIILNENCVESAKTHQWCKWRNENYL